MCNISLCATRNHNPGLKDEEIIHVFIACFIPTVLSVCPQVLKFSLETLCKSESTLK